MKNQKENDWRLIGYNGNLNGQTFKYALFKSTKSNDHEHCIFCSIKITDLDIISEETYKDGYFSSNIKTNQINWVCKDCFNEFKSKFDFKLE